MSTIDANMIMSLQNTIAGDNTKPLSTIDTLASLKALNFFAKGEGIDETVGAIAKNEIAYLTASMKAINDNPLLSMKFGNGLDGAMNLSQLLKQRNGQRIYEQTLDVYAKDVKNKEAELLTAGSKSPINFNARVDE